MDESIESPEFSKITEDSILDTTEDDSEPISKRICLAIETLDNMLPAESAESTAEYIQAQEKIETCTNPHVTQNGTKVTVTLKNGLQLYTDGNCFEVKTASGENFNFKANITKISSGLCVIMLKDGAIRIQSNGLDSMFNFHGSTDDTQ